MPDTREEAAGPSDRYRRLVDNVINNLHRVSVCGDPNGHPRWYVASEVFGLGSTSAMKLCEEFGVDPNVLVGGFEEYHQAED